MVKVLRNGYYHLDCVLGTCSQSCKPSQTFGSEAHNDEGPQLCNYYQFERKVVPYKSKKTGEMKESQKVVRIDYSKTIEHVTKLLSDQASPYMYHRYLVCNDNYTWPKILSTATSDSPVFHMDYSENLQCTPKYEPQSHHFSGSQVVLHCTVVNTDENNHYVYHFTDGKVKDHHSTLYIIKDLISSYVNTANCKVIRLRADNCTVQYKCKNVFGAYLKLAGDLGVKVMVYYGVSGHGKG